MFWPGPTCYQIVFRITGRAWLVFWWVKTLWPRRKLNKCMYFIVFQMWGPKALIPQVVWKCFSLNGNVATFCLVGVNSCQFLHHKKELEFEHRSIIVCFPTIEKLGILQLKPQLTLNPTIFEHPLRLGGMSGGADVWKWWIMLICESSCPENVKILWSSEGVFFATCPLGGGFSKLYTGLSGGIITLWGVQVQLGHGP